MSGTDNFLYFDRHGAKESSLRPHVELAGRLLDDGLGAWVLVNACSCAMTVGLVVDFDKGGALRQNLNELAAAFLRQPEVRAPGLLRQPSLQILVIPELREGEARKEIWRQKVALEANRLEACVGLTLPDFQVDYHDRSTTYRGLAWSEEESVKVFHLSFLEDLRPAGWPNISVKEVEDLERQLAEAVHKCMRMCDDFEGATSVKAALQAVQKHFFARAPDEGDGSQIEDRLLQQVRLFALSGLDESEGLIIETKDPHISDTLVPLFFTSSLSHWETPVFVPISPFTLVSAGNGSGKTSLVEGFSSLVTGATRARIDGAAGMNRQFGQRRLGYLKTQSEGLSEAALSSHHLFPVFSDDAEISTSEAPLTSFARVWSWPKGGIFVKAVQELLHPMRRLTAAIQRAQLIAANKGVAGSGWIKVSPTLQQRVNLALGRRIQQRPLMHYFGDQNNGVSPYVMEDTDWHIPENTEIIVVKMVASTEILPDAKLPAGFRSSSSDLGNEIRKLMQEYRASPNFSVDEFQHLPKNMGKTLRARLWTVAARDISSAVLTADWVDLLEGLGSFEERIQKLTRRALQSSESVVRAEPRCMDQDLSMVLGEHEELDQLVGRLDKYLSVNETFPSSGPNRRNTAASVRRDIAHRLAPVLAQCGDRLPVLALDEPALGQHTEAGARILARFTRLTRFAEGRAWRVAASESSLEILPRRLEAYLAVKNEPGGDEDSPPYARGGYTFDPRLLPPTLLVFSYSKTALDAVADLEGQVIDHVLRERLRKLVFEDWARRIGEEARTARDAMVDKTERESLSWIFLSSIVIAKLGKMEEYFPFKDTGLGDPVFDAKGEATWRWKKWKEDVDKALADLGIGALLPKGDLKKGDNYGEWSEESARELPHRLLLWMALAGLLPALYSDSEFCVAVPTAALRRLDHAGGDVKPYGAQRVRRVTPAMLVLPAVPSTKVATPTPTTATTASTASTASGDPSLPKLPADDGRALSMGERLRQINRLALVGELLRVKDQPFEGPLCTFRLGIHGIPVDWNPGNVHYTISATDDAQIPVRFGADLDELRSALVEVGGFHLQLYLRATSAIAVRLGFVFREVTRDSVSVMSGPIGLPEIPWGFEVVDSTWESPTPMVRGEEADNPEELHLVVLVTANGSSHAYNNWRKLTPGSALPIKQVVVQSPRPLNIQNAGQMNAFATDLHRLITEHRPSSGTIRLFLAAPISLCVALGRKLNALGRVVLMDHDKPRNTYFERFTLNT
jgi:hypothetical protein